MAGEGRRSTAAQFFIEEDAACDESKSTYDRVKLCTFTTFIVDSVVTWQKL